MDFKKLAKRIFFSFFVVFSGAVLSMTAILYILSPGRIGIRLTEIVNLLILALLAISTQFVLFSKRKLNRKQIFFRYTIVAFLAPIIVLFGAVLIGWFDLDDLPNDLAIAMLILLSVVMLVIVVLIEALFHTKGEQRLERLDQEKEYYLSQYNLMQESVEQVKAIRHDMKLHLTAIREYAIDNKKATDYLSGLLEDISKSEIYSDTGNLAFDSVINFKLNQAKANNVKLDIRLFIPPVLNIDVANIVTILGNLLDNALDAVARVENKMIKLDIEFSRESLFIQIDNTFDGVVTYESGKGGDKHHILTRKDGGMHGHGLKNVRRAVEKYNGQVDVSYEGNIFSVTVFFYVDGT